MSLEYTVTTLDNLDENTRKLYKETEDKKGFVLDVTGAVAKSEYDKVSDELATARKSAVGDDGRTYREMFEGSQKANKAIRDERDAFKAELEGWKAFGTIDKVKAMQDENDAFKAKGQKLDELTQANIGLKQSERNLQAQLQALSEEKKALEAAKKELENYKSEAERKADVYDAEQKIAAVVDGIKEANKKALKSQLLDRYRMGDLVRAPNGDIVSKDDAVSLAEYAKDKMESYGLLERSTPNLPNSSTPPPSAKDQATGLDAVASMFH